MSDYLKGAAPASVPGIRLVCKQLLAVGPSPTSKLTSDLRPNNLMIANGEGATLPASLDVASDLGLITKLASGRDPDWEAGPILMASKDPSKVVDSAAAFRPLAAGALNKRARECVGQKQDPSDVAKGLVWLLGRDPLASISWDKSDAELVRSGLKKAKVIENLTQWRPFWRWCIALGYGHQLSLGGRRVLSVRSTTALKDFASCVNGVIPAKQFIAGLLDTVPVLGHPDLVNTLPESGRPQWQGSASALIAEGLYRLEAHKLVDLQPGDDSENVVQLAPSSDELRVIRSVEWIGSES